MGEGVELWYCQEAQVPRDAVRTYKGCLESSRQHSTLMVGSPPSGMASDVKPRQNPQNAPTTLLISLTKTKLRGDESLTISLPC